MKSAGNLNHPGFDHENRDQMKYSLVKTFLSLALTVLVLERFDAFREVIKQRCTSAGLCAEISVEGLAGLSIRLILILHALFHELRPHRRQLLFPGLLADSVQPGLLLISVPVGYRISNRYYKNKHNQNYMRDS